jgi:hypothetical protein
VTQRKNSVMEFTSTFVAIQLTRENLGGLLQERVLNKHPFVFTDAAVKRVIDKHL